MSPKALLRRAKRRPLTKALAVALAAGVLVHLVGLIAVGSTWRFPAPPTPAPTYVRAVAADSSLNERAELLDPSPLFLPAADNREKHATKPQMLNAEDPPFGAPRRDIKETEAGIKEFAGMSAAPTVAAKSLEESIGRKMNDAFLMIGRQSPQIPQEASHKTTLQLKNHATGTPIETRETAAKAVDSSENILRAPAEFFVEVDSYGVGTPVLKKSSGDRNADVEHGKTILDNLLTTPPREGKYLIVVTP